MAFQISKILRNIALVTVPALTFLVVACGDDDDATTPVTPAVDSGTGTETAPTATTGTITGTIIYTGPPKAGPISIAAFKTFPPAPGALPDSFTTVPNPTFPAAFELKNVPSGKITVTAYINQFGSMGTPGPTDPAGIAAADVPAGGTIAVELTLHGPPPGDGGADGGDGGDSGMP